LGNLDPLLTFSKKENPYLIHIRDNILKVRQIKWGILIKKEFPKRTNISCLQGNGKENGKKINKKTLHNLHPSVLTNIFHMTNIKEAFP